MLSQFFYKNLKCNTGFNRLKQIKYLSTKFEHYDIIVAGGGLVGFSASLALGVYSIVIILCIINHYN